MTEKIETIVIKNNFINEKSMLKIIKAIFKNDDAFYEKVAYLLSDEEYNHLRGKLAVYGCQYCIAGYCRVESYEKQGVNEDGTSMGSECIGWDNRYLIGRSKVTRETNPLRLRLR